MKCEEWAGRLLEYGSEGLDTGAAAEWERHLETCPACREKAAAQRAVWRVLDEWEAPPVGIDFDRQVYARIGERTRWWERLPLGPPGMRRGLLVAAAACATIVGALLLESPAGPARAPRTDQAHVESIQPDQVEHALDDLELLGQFDRAARPESAVPTI